VSEPAGTLGKILIISQVGLSLLLVVGAGLFLNSLRHIFAIDPGFGNREDVLLVTVDALGAGYRGSRAVDFYKRLIESVSVLPGVRSVSSSWIPPVSADLGGNNGNASIEGYTARPGEDMVVWSNLVSPGYFRTVGQRMLGGRDFTWRDQEHSPGVAIINQTMARRFFANQNPVGKRINFQGTTMQIIGVVKDAKYQSLTEPTLPVLFTPIAQAPGFLEQVNLMLEVRSNIAPKSIISEVRNEIRVLGKDIAITTETLKAHVDQSLTTELLIAILTGFFSGLALLLAAIGLYGLMAYRVSRRTNEIGIRIALGAERRSVIWMVLKEALLLAGTGIAAGVLIALPLTRYVSSLLFDLKPNDPATFSVCIVVLATVAVSASYLPARRASHVDPMVALRYE
jgi:predicted permease